jgi:6-phospho-beta-glucosidase
MKIAVIGCGLRTPLLIHGLAHSDLPVESLVLYDTAPGQSELMTSLGRVITAGMPLKVTAGALSEAIEGSSFVISSIRVGGMSARAADERLSIECGFTGQETTGPAGFAMALRTIPVAMKYARLVEKLAPEAWIVNFTNPAGLITQAISSNSGARVVGICDTPAELFFRISLALGRPAAQIECGYWGLNHLGWVHSVLADGDDVTPRIFADDQLIRSLYPAELFPPELIRSLQLIPTEYLFFYYRQRIARENQLRAGATRGEELLTLNQSILSDLRSSVQQADAAGALRIYRSYLNRRNASYMRLEGAAQSAFSQPDFDWDPFEGATGYHRIAVDAIRALCASQPSRMVLNVPNQGAIEDLAPEDVIEVPCMVDRLGPRPLPIGQLPATVRGLVTAVKMYERLAIEAATRETPGLAVFALSANPIVGDWDGARSFVEKLDRQHPE